MKKVKKAFGLFFLVIIGLLVWDIWFVPSQSDLFFKLWAEDLRQLQQERKLPDTLQNVREVSIQTINQEATDLMNKGNSPFETQPDGSMILEILVDVWQDEEAEHPQRGVFLQYDLIAEDGNTIWELSRTIMLPDTPSLILSWLPELFPEVSE